MRKLIVTRGLPGSGKSTALKALNLDTITLSPDVFRLLISGPVMGQDGRFHVNQSTNQVVWPMMMNILDQRMARGETVVVDATHLTSADFKPYIDKARIHRYEVGCLDIDVPFHIALSRNNSRKDWTRVPDFRMMEMNELYRDNQVPESIVKLHNEDIPKFLEAKVLNLDKCKRVVHVGDLQGCVTVLKDLIEKLGGIQESDHWIFVGDALDRGIENGELIKFLMEDVINRPNVDFLWGNHEDHLHRYAVGLESVSREFQLKTLPQLKRAGITPEIADKFMNKVKDYVYYTRNDDMVMVNHAGLSGLPTPAWMLSTRQCAHGVGYYEEPIDHMWDTNTEKNGFIQVHGHRNSFGLPVNAGKRSFNLEGAVEFGGNLRAVVLDDLGWTPIMVRNPIISSFRERLHKKGTLTPAWMAEGTENETYMPEELWNAMQAHSEVREKPMGDFPHISSLNFSKKVFFDKSWDDIVVKARGLFVDTTTQPHVGIVARSGDKFFNVGEREETQIDVLAENLSYPIVGWIKENGFLGISGYDKKTDSLFLASKSTSEGDFANIVKEIVLDNLGSVENQERFKRKLRDLECSAIFEIIDPIRDPHITKYEKEGLVLLNVLQRSANLRQLPYEQLVEFAKEFDFPVKQKGVMLPNAIALKKWHERVSRDMSKEFEGYVMEDAKGFNFKVKLPWYSYWKWMRGVKDVILKERTGGRVLNDDRLVHRATVSGLDFTIDQAKEFVSWCREQPDDVLIKDIIQIREIYNVEDKPVPGLK
jgi:predicted kinase